MQKQAMENVRRRVTGKCNTLVHVQKLTMLSAVAAA